MYQLWFSHFSSVAFQRNGKYFSPSWCKPMVCLTSEILSHIWKNCSICFLWVAKILCEGNKKKCEGQERTVFWSRQIISMKYWLILWQSEINLDLLMHSYKNMKTLPGEGCNVWGAIHLLTDMNHIMSHMYMWHINIYCFQSENHNNREGYMELLYAALKWKDS